MRENLLRVMFWIIATTTLFNGIYHISATDGRLSSTWFLVLFWLCLAEMQRRRAECWRVEALFTLDALKYASETNEKLHKALDGTQ